MPLYLPKQHQGYSLSEKVDEPRHRDTLELTYWMLTQRLYSIPQTTENMVDLNTFKQLQQAPIEERIQMIELLLQSVKDELKSNSTSSKPFKVHSFSLGGNISLNRDELYSERTL